jgi:N-acetyl-alpha-D-muramate 1-phosphate uridylyltransferase
MQIAIIAGGFATRLGAMTKDVPKSLLCIQGKPFIEYQFDFLRNGGITEVVLCLGHLGRNIEEHCGNGSRFGLELKYSYESKPLDTAGALKNAEPLLEDPFFTLYGDSYVFLDFTAMLKALTDTNIPAAMSVYKNINQYDKSNTSIDNGRVMQYSKVFNQRMEYIDYGVNLFRKPVLRLVPSFEPYSMESLFSLLIKNRELLAYEVKERFYEIGSFEGLQELTRYVKDKV